MSVGTGENTVKWLSLAAGQRASRVRPACRTAMLVSLAALPLYGTPTRCPRFAADFEWRQAACTRHWAHGGLVRCAPHVQLSAGAAGTKTLALPGLLAKRRCSGNEDCQPFLASGPRSSGSVCCSWEDRCCGGSG